MGCGPSKSQLAMVNDSQHVSMLDKRGGRPASGGRQDSLKMLPSGGGGYKPRATTSMMVPDEEASEVFTTSPAAAATTTAVVH